MNMHQDDSPTRQTITCRSQVATTRQDGSCGYDQERILCSTRIRTVCSGSPAAQGTRVAGSAELIKALWHSLLSQKAYTLDSSISLG